MDDAGLQLLRSIEQHMRELVGEMRRQNDATEELTRRRKLGAAREAKRRSALRQNDATHDAIVTPQPEVLKALKQVQVLNSERGVRKRHADPEHAEMVLYGTAAFEKATGAKYPFEKQDAKHIENLLKNHTLQVCKRVVDLACDRYRTEPFHAARGLSFKLAYAEATALLTAKPRAAPEAAEKDKANQQARRETAATKDRIAKLDAIEAQPMPEHLKAQIARIGNGT